MKPIRQTAPVSAGVMLAEKQKAKYTYGVLERQFRNMFDKAAKADGITCLLYTSVISVQRSR